jgi:flagellar motor switch protein FliN
VAEDQNEQQETSEPKSPDEAGNQDPDQNADTSVQEKDDSQEVIPDLPDFSGMVADALDSSIELLKDVDLNVKIELGRTEMTVKEILKLGEGAVVELDKLAGDPVDVLVNEQLIARGEVLVLNENFCVRINEIVPGIVERMARE